MTARRSPRQHLAWIAAAVAATLALFLLLLAPPSLSGGPNWALDFLAYRDAAARVASEGTPYLAATVIDRFHPGPTGLYLYPPPLGIAVTPLSGVSFEAGAMVWYALHVVCLILACALMPVSTGIRVASFAVSAVSFAVLRDLTMGNVSVLLLLPTAMAWRWLDQPLGSIAQAVAMSIRPMLGILVIWQLLRRQWRAVAWTIGAGAAIALLTLPFVGVGGYTDYLAVLRNIGDTTGVLRNSDAASTALALGVPRDLAGWWLVPGYIVAIGAILLSLRRDPEVGFMVTVTASLLLTPLLWDHYLSLLVLPAAFLAARGRPWALPLPLLTWLPAETYPLLVVAAMLLPFLARDAGPSVAGASVHRPSGDVTSELPRAAAGV